MKIIITKNYNDLSSKAVEFVVKEILRKKSAILGLPTGGTPMGLYRKLIKMKIDFSKIKIFTLDEYYGLDKNSNNSYYYYMKKYLFSHINIPEKNIYTLNGKAKNIDKECYQYEKLIKKNPIDLIVLGIGKDGHIGFNEPGSSLNSKTRLVNLDPSTRKANSIYFNNKIENVPKKALTVGISTIMSAKKILLLASGIEKADIIRNALKEDMSKDVPASVLKLHSHLTVILDNRASLNI